MVDLFLSFCFLTCYCNVLLIVRLKYMVNLVAEESQEKELELRLIIFIMKNLMILFKFLLPLIIKKS